MAPPGIRPSESGTANRMFGSLSAAAWQALEAVTFTTTYPDGATLFLEEQAPRGAFVVRQGRVKLSVCAPDGKTLILRIAEAGEIVGLGAVVAGRPYEATAETQGPCEASFIRPADLLRLMHQHNELALHMAQHLSEEYNSTCREIRNLMLSESAKEKLARLLVGWMKKQEGARPVARMTVALTHEEIAQMIGTSRETVTRLFATFKKQQLIQQHGSTLVVRNRTALESLVPA